MIDEKPFELYDMESAPITFKDVLQFVLFHLNVIYSSL